MGTAPGDDASDRGEVMRVSIPKSAAATFATSFLRFLSLVVFDGLVDKKRNQLTN